MDTLELPAEASSLEERVELFNEVGRAIKGALEWYFEPKVFEREEDGRVYRFLGVHYFKKIVPTGGTYVNRLLGDSWKESMKDRRFLSEFQRKYRVAEVFHDLSFLVVAYYTLDAFKQGQISAAIVCTAVNTALNVYPILLQRYNRARIYNTIEKLETQDRREQEGK